MKKDHVAAGLVAAVALGLWANVWAMPTQAELKKAQPLVAELMAPALKEFKAADAKEKAAAAVKVADASAEFAKAAETEAAKFLLLKGAVNFYTRGEEYDKAADAVETLKASVKDVTPAVISEIAGKATGKISETKAPRLFALYRKAKLQLHAASEAKALVQKLKKVKSDALQRRYAEALAISGDWKTAYAEFAKLSDAKLKAVVEAEAKDKAKNAESGEFWWAYKPDFEEADDFFKEHAAVFYRKALAAGEITGLKKNIVEQRIKEFGDATAVAADGAMPIKPKRITAKQLTYAGYLTKDNVLLWKEVSVDDIQSFTATVAGGHINNPGNVVGHIVDSGDGWKSVQFQLHDGVGGKDFLKCVYSRFEQIGNEVHGHVEKAVVADASVVIGTDLRTADSAREYYLCFEDKGVGYGLKDLVIAVGGKSAVTMASPAKSATAGKSGSAWQEKGNEATLDLGEKYGKLEFVKCPAGSVRMTTGRGEVTRVNITRPFWIMKTPVTCRQISFHPQERNREGYAHCLRERTEEFIDLVTKERLGKGALPLKYVLRLPTLAEIEYAFHANTHDRSDPYYDWLADHVGDASVSKKWKEKANAWGLRDFGWEKVLDNFMFDALKDVNKNNKNVSRTKNFNVVPVCVPEDKSDPLFWTEDEKEGVYVSLMFDWALWRCRLPPSVEGGGDYTYSRLVVGPDLVSEWKAKNAKK